MKYVLYIHIQLIKKLTVTNINYTRCVKNIAGDDNNSGSCPSKHVVLYHGHFTASWAHRAGGLTCGADENNNNSNNNNNNNNNDNNIKNRCRIYSCDLWQKLYLWHVNGIQLGCVPLGWFGSGSVIRDPSDHGRSNETMNPCPKCIHPFILSTMIRVISDHWSWSGCSQKNAPLIPSLRIPLYTDTLLLRTVR